MDENNTSVINSLDQLASYIASKNNADPNVYFSPIPEICKIEKCIIEKNICMYIKSRFD